MLILQHEDGCQRHTTYSGASLLVVLLIFYDTECSTMLSIFDTTTHPHYVTRAIELVGLYHSISFFEDIPLAPRLPARLQHMSLQPSFDPLPKQTSAFRNIKASAASARKHFKPLPTTQTAHPCSLPSRPLFRSTISSPLLAQRRIG